MFRAPCAHHQEVKILLYSLWYHHTYRWPEHVVVPVVVDAQYTANKYRCVLTIYTHITLILL